MKTRFADRLMAGIREKGPLCVGIDPHAAMLPALFGKSGPEAAAKWGVALVERAVGRASVVKPQAGLFERWGASGLRALEEVCRAATRAGLIVILDAKRGDIGSTADGYAEGYLGADSSCPCDAITVNPYMGIDTIEPFVAVAEREGKGVVVLARTSNPGSKDFQQKLITEGEGQGEPLYLHVARALAPMVTRLRSPETGWSGLMLVAGATGPQEAARLRAVSGDALFLVPGYGAQGAGAREALAGFVQGPHGLEGGVVNASRSVAMPDSAKGATSVKDWERAIDNAITAAQAELVEAARS
ncbi:MAG TPA: orotidine-5'-phosphate decarboxylase [Hyphomonadaceae bacterium]|nr:orotidine-5'-phosphate decarboxylase [Hyphomonadaceae bacterium]HPN06480.1 orotidine-5'-phosphate decarboxylase [Hyphomonadaceae bacterium]